MRDFLVRVRLCGRHIAAAITALQFWGDHLHDDARHQKDPKQAKRIREEAEECFAARTSLQNQMPRADVKMMSDDSVHGNSAPVQITRFSLPKDARELVTAIILAVSIVGNCVMFVEYRALQQVVDLDRYDDNTFINGRFAELSAQAKADHELIQAYGLQKSLKEK